MPDNPTPGPVPGPEEKPQGVTSDKPTVDSVLSDLWKFGVVAVVVAVAVVWGYSALGNAVERIASVGENTLRIAPRAAPLEIGTGTDESDEENTPAVQPAPQPERKKEYIPPEAEIVITPKDQSKRLLDIVDISVTHKFGFSHELGVDLVAATGGLGLGADVKLLYFHKIGAEIGAAMLVTGNQIQASPFVGLSYRLDASKFLQNTEVMAGWAPGFSVPAFVGVRVNL